MQLDHFVVHVHRDIEALRSIARESERAGIAFNPRNGKGDSGFKVANIWIGEQYFEILWLKKPSGGGWRRDWVSLYNEGKRGIYCLFLKVDDLGYFEYKCQEAGVLSKREKVTYKTFFGLFKKTMPWECLHLPKLTNSDLELSFITYEGDIMKEYLKYMTPNSSENGIVAVTNAKITVPNLEQDKKMLLAVFGGEERGGKIEVKLANGTIEFTSGKSTAVTLQAQSNSATFIGKKFSIENVTTIVTPNA